MVDQSVNLKQAVCTSERKYVLFLTENNIFSRLAVFLYTNFEHNISY